MAVVAARVEVAKVAVAARAVVTGRVLRVTPREAEGETIRPRNEEDVMSNSNEMTLTQSASNPLVVRMQAVADERGHGGATKGAGVGGMLGAMAGSFWGLGTARNRGKKVLDNEWVYVMRKPWPEGK